MQYWTIQTVEAWNQAQALGFLKGNPEYVWQEFMRSYRWMISQMKQRMPRYDGEFPVWLWTGRPDLRFSGRLAKGQRGVLLEVRLEADDVLISDFQAWHMVLNDHFLALTEREEELYDNGALALTKEESWERIFDYEFLQTHDCWSGEQELQAVAGTISLDKLKLLKEFTAR